MLLLIVPALSWPLPMRWHLPVQAAMLAMLSCFSVGPRCNSKLLSGPQMASLAGSVHRVYALGAAAFVPVASALEPLDDRAQVRRRCACTGAACLPWQLRSGPPARRCGQEGS